MLIIIGAVVTQLTDPENLEEDSVNKFGQIKEGFKLNLEFDQDNLDFLSLYFKQGKKKEWLEQTCCISFRLSGIDREMILFASEHKRSKIDVKNFLALYVNELDQPWRSVVGQNKKKRPISTPVALPAQQVNSYVETPLKKTCLELFISPQGKSIAVSKTMKSTPILKAVQVIDIYGIKASLMKASFLRLTERAVRRRELYLHDVAIDPKIRSDKITAVALSHYCLWMVW